MFNLFPKSPPAPFAIHTTLCSLFRNKNIHRTLAFSEGEGGGVDGVRWEEGQTGEEGGEIMV